jgi:hypothetical protein
MAQARSSQEDVPVLSWAHNPPQQAHVVAMQAVPQDVEDRPAAQEKSTANFNTGKPQARRL